MRMQDKNLWRCWHPVAFAALMACGAPPAGEIPAAPAAAPPMQTVVPAGMVMDTTMKADLDALRGDLGRMSEELGRAGATEGVVVRVRGRGQVESGDARSEGTSTGGPIPKEPAEAAAPSLGRWVAVNLATGNEFEVSFPTEVLEAAGQRAYKTQAHLGSRERADEAQEGAPIADGWSNGMDSRVIHGTYNVAQTHDAYKKIVSLGTNGGCTGTLVGPKHIVTAAHCIRSYKTKKWIASTAYAGRSGPNAFRAQADYSPTGAPTWFWLPADFLTIADGQATMPFAATPYDIGVLVTHSSRMGDVVGWMGWYWWASDADFGNRTRYNRGYPVCGSSNSPVGCDAKKLALWGDTEWCAAGEYSSPDSDGINRRFRFHCDISGGHSGSSLYHYLDGTTLVVTGIVSWEHCTTCGAADERPNTGVRITKQYADAISALRSAFP